MDETLRLTPSELELLKASAGTNRILFSNLARKLTDESSDFARMLKRTFLSALIANQAVGTIVCEIDRQRAPWALKARTRVLISANGVQYQWPEPSLEASIASLVQSLAGRGGALTITRLVKAWLGQTAVGHFQAGIRWVFESMADRGWVQRCSEQRLALFSLPSYEIPAETKRVVDEFAGNDYLHPPAVGVHARLPETDAIIADELDKELRKLLLS